MSLRKLFFAVLIMFLLSWGTKPAFAADGDPGSAENGQVGDQLDDGRDMPGDEEPGDEEPGDEEPGDEEPGDEDPGNEEPGNEEPGNEEPGNEEPEPNDDSAIYQPSYKNAAEAAHAARLAEAASMEYAEDSDAATAYNDMLKAKQEWEDEPGDEDLEKKYLDAQNVYQETVANTAGVRKAQIMQLREAGYGWGQIAHELSVHPGALGLKYGHYKKSGPIEEEPIVENEEIADIKDLNEEDLEMLEATQRIVQTGWNKGKGNAKGNTKRNSANQLGLTETSTNAATASSGGKGKGSSGLGSSVGGGKSTKGNSGVGSQVSSNGKKGTNGKNNSNKEDRGNSGKSSKSSSNGKGNSGNSNGNSNGKGNK